MEKSNLKWKKRLLYVSATAVIAVIVILISTAYIIMLNNAIKENTINEINEITQHDQIAIKNYVSYNIENLKRVSRRMRRAACETVDQFKTNLGYERAETPFSGVYYVDTEGNIYTADAVISPDEFKHDLLAELTNGQDKFIKRFNFESELFAEKCRGEQLVYGMTMKFCFASDEDKTPLTLGDTQFVAVLGITRLSALQRGLVLDSFDIDGVANGNSAVINLSGQYIVDPQFAITENLSRNFFEEIDNSEKCTLSSGQIRLKMENWEHFTFDLTEKVYDQNSGTYKTESKFYSCIPIDDQEPVRWYFLLSVNKSLFSERSYSLIIMNLVELLIVVLIVLAALLLIMFNQYKSANAIAKEKAQSEFLSNMSHEIRTPLNGLVGLNYLIVNAIDEPEKHEQIKEWLKKSQSTAKYLLSLVNDVLDMSKLQAGKVDIVKEPMLIESITDAVWSMQRDNIERRGIRFIPDINITEPCIMGDSVRIKQVLVNLVSNAAKFTPAGGSIIICVNQEPLGDGKVLTTITCEDTGCGMSPEFLETIFEAFTQERNKNTASIKGTGLGMAISKLLVDAMGGELLVESQLNIGSKFTIKLPAEIAKTPDYISQQTVGIVQKQEKRTKPLKLLVAEDNELNAEVILEILGDEGFIADHAADGQKAVEMFSASEPGEYDVILMDMRMPVMDGCTASEKIRELDRPDAKKVLIYACTANTFEEDKIRAIQSGMNDFLTKPIDVKVLLQKLENTVIRSDGDNK